MSRRRMEKLREQKKLLKARMLKRKKKYASDPELKGLYGFMGEEKDGKAKLDRKKLGSREERGMTGSGSDAREAMKSAAAEKQGSKRHLYYKAKEAESIEQYDEIKEAIHKHKNIRRENVIALIQQIFLAFLPALVPRSPLGSKVETVYSVLENQYSAGGEKSIRTRPEIFDPIKIKKYSEINMRNISTTIWQKFPSIWMERERSISIRQMQVR